MIHTFDGLRREILRNLDEEDDASTTEQLAGDFLNQAHQVRALEYGNYFLLFPREETITTTIGMQRYALNPLVDRLLYLRNSTEDILLREIPNRGLSTGEFNWASEEGSASEFMFWGHSAVKANPLSSGVISVVSDSSSDTGSAYKITLQGVTSDGDIASEVITLNGTTPVAGSTSFVEILTVTKTATFNGTITLSADSGATTILVLGPSEMGKQYRQIYLIQSPTTSEILKYRFFRKPLRMVGDFDVPDLPSPYSEILVWDSLLLFAGYNTDIRETTIAMWRDQRAKWEKALEEYLRDVQTLGAQPLFVQNREGDFSGHWPVFGG